MIHPDLAKLRCGLLTVKHSVINPLLKEETKEKTLKLIVSQPQIIFLMLNDTDCVLFGLSKDYEGHKTFISDHLKILQENKCILNDPLTELISVPKIKFQKTEFAPLVKKIFDLDVKF